MCVCRQDIAAVCKLAPHDRHACSCPMVANFSSGHRIAQVFRRLHAAYVDAVSNPFYTIGQPITSRRFNDSVKTAVEVFAVSLA